jgi:hypothetical protein
MFTITWLHKLDIYDRKADPSQYYVKTWAGARFADAIRKLAVLEAREKLGNVSDIDFQYPDWHKE